MSEINKSGIPLNEGQTGIYLECTEQPQSLKYNMPMLVRLPENIEKDRLIQAVRTVIGAHEAFFSTVREVQGIPKIVLGYKEVTVTEAHAESIEKAVEDFCRPFDFANGPLYRFVYLQTPEGDALLADVHHIIFDGSSLHLLFREIAAVYENQPLSEESPSFSELAVQTAADPEEARRCREMIKEELDGADFHFALSSDVVTKEKSEGMGIVEMPLADVLSISEAESFVKANQLNENALFAGTYGYTLALYGGTGDAVFTTAHHGRSAFRNDPVIGMYVRTIPLRAVFTPEESPAEYLKRIYNSYYRMHKNNVIGYSEIAAEYGIRENLTFVYQADLFSDFKIAGEYASVDLLNNNAPISDLEFTVRKNPDGYIAFVKYNKAMYTEAFVRGFTDTFIHIASEMCKAETLGSINPVSAYNRSLIDSFNKTEKEWDREKTVIDLFREQVRKTPDAECLVYEDRHFTYRETDEITERLAEYLVKHGIQKGSIAGILIPRSEYMLLGALGVLKSGAAYMPLDPSYPAERLNGMLEDSKASFLITTKELSDIVPETFPGERLMTDEIETLTEEDVTLPVPSPEDLFVVLYTSGSTGKPKGVMFSHANTAVTAAWERDFYNFGTGSRIAAYASFGFDANVFDMYPAITSGAALHIIPESLRLDLYALQSYFNENGITNCIMTTQVGSQFARMKGTKTLKTLSVGGEKLAASAPPEDFRFFNLYGPTEGTILVTAQPVDQLYDDIPIGKAIDNVKLYVVDRHNRLVPPGAVGELWITGPHVTPGYLNNPERTAQAYTDNPFCDEPGYERAYRTGDTVRWLPDGNIQFIGRGDSQVKIRGFRIELKEIEEVIRRFEGIRDATVADFDDPAGGKFIAAYVVADTPVDIEALNDFIRNEKPPYMVPAVTMQIERIPLNQNQKVNRKALPLPVRQAAEETPPENEIQSKIFDLTAEVLGHRSFGIDTDLSEAGLTSVGMLKLNVTLSEAFGINMKISDLRTHETVRKLADLLDTSEKTESFERMDDYPLTETQMGIFTACVKAPEALTYNIPLLIRLDNSIDPAKLEEAVRKAIDAHPYLKAELFADQNGEIRARRNDSAEANVTRIVSASKPSFEDLMKPFRLLGMPLYRAEIHETAECPYLFLEMHHIISDGTSCSILLEDITRAYLGEEVVPETFTGYEIAQDEKAARESNRLNEAKAYYDSVFAGCETECLPPKSPSDKPVKVISRNMNVDPAALLAYCEKNRISMNVLLNGAFGFTMNRFIRDHEAIYTTVYNGRSDARTSRSVSMLVKTLPVASRTEENRKITAYLSELSDQLLGSMANDIYSFAEISADYGIRPDVMFVYQGDSFAFDSVCGKPAVTEKGPEEETKAPVLMSTELRDGVLACDLSLDGTMYDEAFADALLSAYVNAVHEFTAKEMLAEVSLLSETGRDFVQKINDTKADYPRLSVAEMFALRVKENPDRIAVCDSSAAYTYDELNRLSNRIAHCLSERGVCKDQVVGMMLNRSAMLDGAELGILKAGGAFLGLLPEYPDDRVDYCLRDADSKLVITTEAILSSKPDLFASDKPYQAVTLETLCADPYEKDPETPVSDSALAYCIYTSGTTGKPKGVMVEQRNIVNLANQKGMPYSLYFGSEEDRVSLAMSSISFDMSILDNMMFVLNGKTVCVASEQEIHDPLSITNLIRSRNVNTLSATPSFLSNFISIPEFRDILPKIRTILSGGEAFTAGLFPRLKELAPDVRVINAYGPSECGIVTSASEILKENEITIGGPLQNEQLYVMDRNGNILPPYAVGELIICGANVGRGYVKMPEKTNELFFELNGERAYHSGDIVRLNSDGQIEYYGREDDQIKLRGFRIELGEIERTMSAFPGVRQSIVIVRSNASADYLAGFFTASEPVDIRELTAFMKTKLTYYMVPDVLMQLDAMPLTAAGKIDRKALPESTVSAKKEHRRKPKKSLEAEICELFASVLSKDEFYADDSLFEMGGTSLSASRAVMMLQGKGMDVQYQDIFDHPTPEALAEFIESKRTPVKKETETSGSEETKSEFDDLLKYNTLAHASEVKREPLGDVFLTGSTGFLGIHVLRTLITHETGRIICLIRRKHAMTAEKRLRHMFMYYFDEPLNEEAEKRITVISGDFSTPDLAEQLKDMNIDTIINCAADVRHYAADSSIERANTEGVEKMIQIAKEHNARMIQISTTSIPGMHTEESYSKRIRMHENQLFVIDDMDNKYLLSKYAAELKMLEAIRSGMRGKIIRVGNLMGRYSDGEFQINSSTNAFMNAVRGFAAIGKCPLSHSTDPISFSPIDSTAAAVVLLAGTNDQFTAFHADSRFGFDESQLIEACNRCGVKIIPVDDTEYYEDYRRMLSDPEKNRLLTGLLTNDQPDKHMVETDNTFTANILYRLGFAWPLTDYGYLERAIHSLVTLDYFNFTDYENS